MDKLTILYHSGSGSTRTISEILNYKLSDRFSINLSGISLNFDYDRLSDQDYLIFGFPTFGCKPTRSMLEFLENMPVFDKRRKAFVFTTCALYTGNCLRIFIKMLREKNIYTNSFMQINGPASDGTLLFPGWIKGLFRYRRNTRSKMEKAVDFIKTNFDSSDYIIPPSKWYVPINNLFIGFGEKAYEKSRDQLRIVTEDCTRCGLCVKDCIRGCWSFGENIPVIDTENCEFCLKCVHNCPQQAIIFSNKMRYKPRLNREFYHKLRENFL